MTEDQIERAILDLLANGRERKVAFVIAKMAENRASDDDLGSVEAAIKRLVASGKLEARGNVSSWRQSEVKLIT